MADQGRTPHSLSDQTADQIRSEQRGGTSGAADPGPEGNATLRRVWSEPGGEAMSYRNSLEGAGAKAEDHSDLTAAETPEATRRLSDATLKPEDQDATAEAIARATAVNGDRRKS